MKKVPSPFAPVHTESPFEFDATGFVKPGEYQLGGGVTYEISPPGDPRNHMSLASFRVARMKNPDMVYIRGTAFSGAWLLEQIRTKKIYPHLVPAEQIKAAMEGDGVIDL